MPKCEKQNLKLVKNIRQHFYYLGVGGDFLNKINLAA